MKRILAVFIGLALFGTLASQAVTYTYSGAQNTMNQAQCPVATYDTVDWNITSGYFGTTGARSQTYANPNLTFTAVAQNNGWGEAVTRFSSATTVTGAGAFSLTAAGLSQDFVFAGNMQGYTGNLSIADAPGNAGTSITLGNTASSVVQYGGETSGGNKALGTVTTDGTGNWINNVAGSGSLTVRNVVFNYGTDASYNYIKVTNAIAQNVGVHFIGNADVLASGVISSSGALNKSGSGTLTLSNANTYTGNTTVSAGTLDLTSGKLYTSAHNNTSVVTVTGTVLVNNYSYGAANSFGMLSDYAARRVIDGGTIEVRGASHSSGQDFTVNAAGGTFRYNPTNTADTLTLTGNNNTDTTINGTLTFDTIGNITVDDTTDGSTGIIIGAGGITKTGAGTLRLNGANTYSGATTVNGGTLWVGGSLASAPTVNAGAKLVVSGTAAIAGNITVAAGGTFDTMGEAATYALVNGQTLSLGGGATDAVTGNLATAAGSILRPGVGAGTAATAKQNGNLDLAGGTVQFDLSDDPVAGANDQLQLTGTLNAASATTVAINPTALTLSNGVYPLITYTSFTGDLANLSLTGVVSGGRQTIALSTTTVANTLTLDVAGAAAHLVWNNAAATGIWDVNPANANWDNGGTNDKFVSGDVVELADTANPAETITVEGDVDPANLLDTHSTATAFTLTGPGRIVGSIGLTKTGAGTTTLTTTNTFTGGTTVSNGVLEVGGGLALADSGVVTLANTAGVIFRLNASETIGELTGGGATGGNVDLQANTLTTGDANNVAFGGVISGTGALVKQGAGTQALSAQSTYTGGTTVNAGILDLTGGGGAGGTIRGTVTVNSGATLRLNTGDGLGYNADATAVGTLNLVGGTLTTAGGANQTTTADLVLTGGTINGTVNLDLFSPTPADNNASVTTLASATTSTISVASLNLRQDNVVFDVADGDAATDLLISSLVGNGTSGAHNLTKAGAGTMTLSGQNTFSGNAAVNGGRLIFGIGGQAANPNTWGPLGPANTAVTKLTIADGATVDVNGYSNTGYGVTIAGTGTDGQGALVNNGAATFNGNIQTPNIALSADASIGGTGAFYMIASGYNANTLTLNSHTLTKTGANTFYLCNTTITAGTVRVSGGALSQFRASNGSAAAFTLDDTAGVSLSLNGYNLSVGSLAGGGGSGGGVALGANTLTVGSLGTDTSYGGSIVGAGGVTKTGGGTLTLSAANFYGGATTVNGGTLSVTGSLDGTGAVTVAAGAALAGTGTLNGATTVDGTLAPGTATPGTLTVNNTLVLNSTATLASKWANPTLASVNVTGALTLDGTLTVAGLTTMPAGSYTLITYGGGLTDNGLAITDPGDGRLYGIDTTTTPGQVLLTIAETSAYAQWWRDLYGITPPPPEGEDYDGDGTPNGEEFAAKTNPTDDTSYLHLTNVAPSGNDMTISVFTGAAPTVYDLERTDDLLGTWTDIGDITGNDAIQDVTDPGAATGATWFYRAKVK